MHNKCSAVSISGHSFFHVFVQIYAMSHTSSGMEWHPNKFSASILLYFRIKNVTSNLFIFKTNQDLLYFR